MCWSRHRRLDKVEKEKEAPEVKVRKAIDEWIKRGTEEHEETRRQSREQERSIVSTILSLSGTGMEMTDVQHEKALEYLLLQLSIRDRTEIVRVLCKSNPDHLTTAIREAVTAYEPIIRQVHEAVDLSGTVWDFEQFMNDMIRMSKPAKKDSKPPSVEDYVKLLHTHQASTHRFLHQVAKNGKEVTKWFKDFVIEASSNFRAADGPEKTPIKDALQKSVEELKSEDQDAVRKELDSYSKYLDALHASSAARIKDVIANKTSTAYGPGAYLARWQDLLDSTEITPDKQTGPVRKGRNKEVKAEARKDVDGEKLESGVDLDKADKVVGEKTPDAPSMDTTLQLLSPQFRQILLDRTSASGLKI